MAKWKWGTKKWKSKALLKYWNICEAKAIIRKQKYKWQIEEKKDF